jgi:hypothetical protein
MLQMTFVCADNQNSVLRAPQMQEKNIRHKYTNKIKLFCPIFNTVQCLTQKISCTFHGTVQIHCSENFLDRWRKYTLNAQKIENIGFLKKKHQPETCTCAHLYTHLCYNLYIHMLISNGPTNFKYNSGG